jgi:hypothetical protein
MRFETDPALDKDEELARWINEIIGVKEGEEHDEDGCEKRQIMACQGFLKTNPPTSYLIHVLGVELGMDVDDDGELDPEDWELLSKNHPTADLILAQLRARRAFEEEEATHFLLELEKTFPPP